MSKVIPAMLGIYNFSDFTLIMINKETDTFITWLKNNDICNKVDGLSGHILKLNCNIDITTSE